MRTVFRFLDDRYEHRLYLIRGDSERLLLSSIDASDDEFEPPSPPLQQVSQSSSLTDQIVMGVGMAGRSHWSLSVLEIDSMVLLFDVACRVGQSTKSLGSTYQYHGTSQPVLENGLVFFHELDGFFLAGGKTTATGSEELHCRGQTIQIEPTQIPTTIPSTVQWRYRVGFNRLSNSRA